MKISGYHIEEQIGKGGMAMVYRATQESLGRSVALKVMNPLYADDPEFTERFLNEGRILATLQHPNIITIHDVGVSNGFHFISMEYLCGGDLRDRIQAGLGTLDAVRYLRTLTDCLQLAHDRGIVHRDIKPANILFRADDTLLLTDFGIAKQLENDHDLTSTGAMIGSPHYLSPEQAKGGAPDARADVYSLGILFFEMLTGSRPFRGDSDVDIAIQHLNKELPPLPPSLAAFQPLLTGMTAKKVGQRMSSCAEIRRELDRIVPRQPGLFLDSTPTPAQSDAEGGDDASSELPETVELSTLNAANTRRSQRREHRTLARVAGAALVLTGASFLAITSLSKWSLPHSPESISSTIAPGVVAPRDAAILIDAAEQIETTISHADSVLIATPNTPAVQARLNELQRLDELMEIAIRQREEAERAAENQRAATQRARRIALLLRKADRALGELRLTTPEKRSAFYYYSEVLALEPGHQDAREGLTAIADQYYRLAQQSEDAWAFDQALSQTNRGLGIRPDHPGLNSLQRRLLADQDSPERWLKAGIRDVKGWFE